MDFMWIWLIIFGLTVILEIIIKEHIAASFGLGALVAFVLALINLSANAQFFSYAGISILFLILSHTVLRNFLKIPPKVKKEKKHKESEPVTIDNTPEETNQDA